MRRLQLAALAGMLLAAGIRPARAGHVDNFDTQSSIVTTGDPDWLAGLCNGYTIEVSYVGPVCGGQLDSGDDVTRDAGGPGGSGATSDEFHIAASFNATPNPPDTVTFYLANGDDIDAVDSVQPETDSTMQGSALPANGRWNDGNPTGPWQPLSFAWDPGSHTAQLILHDMDGISAQ